MLKPKRVAQILALAAFALTGASLALDRPARAAAQELPAGEGVELVRDRCLNCHEADMIVSQRLSQNGWTREVEKMIRWGAVLNDAEKATMVAYLAAHFGPRRAAASEAADSAAVERGRQIFEAQCLNCHEEDLTRQQRLSRQGWTREVEKMIRWGAAVSDEEKAPLVEYLFRNYGPRAPRRSM